MSDDCGVPMSHAGAFLVPFALSATQRGFAESALKKG